MISFFKDQFLKARSLFVTAFSNNVTIKDKIDSALNEINDVYKENILHLNRIEKVISLSLDDMSQEYIRLMSVPIIYAIWERHFKILVSCCIKVERVYFKKVGDAPSALQALWLLKAGFYQSVVDHIRSVIEFDASHISSDRRTKKKNVFLMNHTFLKELELWRGQPLDNKIENETMVVTYANVNTEVLELNFSALGIRTDGVDCSKLDGLVGRRNDIGHGGLISFPPPKQTAELIIYTKNLLLQTKEACEEKIKSRM